MSAIYIALPIALLLALAGIIAFVWSVRSGQMDDLETPALRIFGEDEERRPSRRLDLPRDKGLEPGHEDPAVKG